MYRIIVALLIAVIFLGCRRENYDADFGKCIFINDPANTGLPQYSEWGYNVYGAYHNNAPWVHGNGAYNTSNVIVGVKNDSTCIYFNGNLAGNLTKVAVLLTKDNMTTLDKLAEWNNKVFDFTANEHKIKIGNNIVQAQSGFFNIKRSRKLIVDGQFIGVILSGVFEVKGNMNSGEFQLSKGRFDILIEKKSFGFWQGF